MNMHVELIDSMGSDLSVCNAARVSMNKESGWVLNTDSSTMEEAEAFAAKVGGNIDWEWITSDRWMGGYPVTYMKEADKKLIKYLAEHKHTSCFEHQAATLRLKVPIFVARQIQRHRTFSYNEVSRRYVKDELEFYWPDKWRKAADNVKQGSSDETVDRADHIQYCVEKTIEGSLITYQQLLDGGVAPEQARMILPQNLMTTFYMSGNLRNWQNFLQLRLDPHSQKETRDVAVMIAAIIKELWPISYEALIHEHV